MTAARTSHPWAILAGGRVLFHQVGSYPPVWEADQELEQLWREGQRAMQPFYQSNGITIYHGDCLDVMPHLAAQSFDAIITDVPYGTTACAWDSPIPFVPMWACLKRLARSRAAVVLFGSQPFTSALVMSNPTQYRYSWVWQKSRASGFLDANKKPLKIHEDIIVFSDGNTNYNAQKEPCARRFKAPGGRASHYRGAFERKPLRAYDDRFPVSVLSIDSAAAALSIHPTQKPLALMEYLIRTYTNEGDTILDFTCGSGTTLRAAKNLKRRAVGIEQDRHYCDVTVKRLEPMFEEALVDDGAALTDLPLFAQELV